MKTKISNGNSKLGTIANTSLTPGATCSAEACATCLKEGCYACKSYRMYKTVRAAWDSNTDMAMNDLPTMEKDLMSYFGGMNAPRFFRIHVGGDFVTEEYAAMWARVMQASPSTNFLALTKQWANVINVDFPANASIVPSGWPDCKIPDAILEKFHCAAYCDDGTNSAEIPADAIECPGNCETCGVCWSLAKRGINVFFRKH